MTKVIETCISTAADKNGCYRVMLLDGTYFRVYDKRTAMPGAIQMAAASAYCGMQGHVATSSSELEDGHIQDLVLGTIIPPKLSDLVSDANYTATYDLNRHESQLQKSTTGYVTNSPHPLHFLVNSSFWLTREH